MKPGKAIIFLTLALTLIVCDLARSQTITSCSVVFITPDCDGCDNKDGDTKIRIVVFGAHGTPVASTFYQEDKEFEDNNSENAVPCAVTDPAGSGAAFAQRIRVQIEPNGNDDWVFSARVIFTLSNGSTTRTDLQGRASVSRSNPNAELRR